MTQPDPKKFTGEYRDKAGRLRVFHVWAQTQEGAEAAVELIGCTGRITGELYEEGDCDPAAPFTQAGRA